MGPTHDVYLCELRMGNNYIHVQVAKLSLTNPRDSLHHDKRQNCKTVT